VRGERTKMQICDLCQVYTFLSGIYICDVCPVYIIFAVSPLSSKGAFCVLNQS
jgi:hypothetical protein